NWGAYNYYNSGYRTAHWRENATSGGHGGILGFDVRTLNENGKEIARAMIEWCLDGETDKRMIEPGSSVLIIGSTDTITPTFNSLESAANDQLIANGLDVVYISKIQIGTTDLSQANGVYLVEQHVSSGTINGWLSKGLNVGLFYTASVATGGYWTWHDHPNSRRYTATGSTGFNNLFSGTQVTAESTGAVLLMTGSYPSGLVRDGHGYYNGWWTGAHRTHSTSGGRVALLTFDPRDLTMAGEALYANMIAWLEGRPYPMMASAADKVALVVNTYDESGGTLSVREEALRDNLTAMGLSVEYVSHVNSSRTDFSRSIFVVFCDYAPGRYLVDHLIDDLGKGVGMYYSSAWRHGGGWGWPGGGGASTFYVVNNSTFLANYSTASSIVVGSGSPTHPEVYNYAPSGWTYTGRMTASGNYRTAFSRENSTTGGRGVIFTFRPDDLTSAGVGVLSETYYYLRGASASIPDGNADLSVTSVSLNISSVSAGDVVDVNATVNNLGSSDVISSFTVSFYIDGRAFGSVLLTNLSAGASTNVSSTWTVLPGTHVIKVVADPVGIVYESNEANNW
ncbi:MAG: hypothetical protein KAQ96_07090, partial [Thermoplasmata archaeon]|nr:hypothetical protein [Thermoplasmata archaeon]